MSTKLILIKGEAEVAEVNRLIESGWRLVEQRDMPGGVLATLNATAPTMNVPLTPADWDRFGKAFVEAAGVTKDPAAAAIHKPKSERTKADVELLKTEGAAYGGCCERFADTQGCDCYESAKEDVPRRNAIPLPKGCGVPAKDLECEGCGKRLYGVNVRDVCPYMNGEK